MYDHEQSPRLGQRLGVEQPGLFIADDETLLPEAPHDGQLVYRRDENKLYIFDGTEWIAPVTG